MVPALTETVIVPGVLPLVGLTVSQGAKEVETEYKTFALVSLTFRDCDPGVEPPL